ncbi:putative methyltransferase [Candidatus Protofrankia californiensis]|uniref:Putative methyltransferase n=1 Tax=Candidatus Protofrankia californiensis TaxID=1839754 RepID=A0A1C3P380_9ACTN|nr:putative methyltransferase [Candidatus Protofrankia californiensis]
MTLVVAAGSASELFARACHAVLSGGQPVAPRDVPTLEVLGASLTLTDPRRRLVDVPPARVINPAFAVAEAMWIVSGSDDPWIYLYNERLADYADDGRLMGAYGPRMRRWHGTTDQLALAREALTDDPETRRAVIQLYDPAADARGYKDVPCTLGYRFFLRDGLLHMHTTMRSQDLWLGFCYDIFTATILQELLAGWLGTGLGSYRLSVDSLHLYAHDVPKARQIPADADPGPQMTPLAIPWQTLDDVLAQVIAGTALAGPGLAEFACVLASYRARKDGDLAGAGAIAASHDGPLATALRRWYQRADRARHIAEEPSR